MNQQTRIYVVEDDQEIRALLQDYLTEQGFKVHVATGGTELDRLLSQHGEPDLIVLDLMLPGEDGFSICRRLRVNSDIPIIMLTARGDDIDRIVGLEMGADDYIPKPFNPRELVARIRAIQRRVEQSFSTKLRRYRVEGLVVDLDGRKVMNGEGNEISLTSAEFDLLECFVTRPNRVLSRDQLMDWTRGRQAEAMDRTIDVQVSRLRKKIENGSEPMIRTLRNAGYMLAVSVTPVRDL